MKSRYIMEHEKKLMITGAVILAIIFISGFRFWQNRQAVKNELELANLVVFVEWFGADVLCDVDWDEIEEIAEDMGISRWILLRSPCKADTLPYTLIWQESGLTGLGILLQAQVNEMLSTSRFDSHSDLVQADIEALLTGGFPILDESSFCAERFLNAVSFMDSIIRDLGIDINIQESWNSLIRED